MIVYKLTTRDGYTRRGLPGETRWGPRVRNEATGPVPMLCSDGVIHSYPSPGIAALMNPIHAQIEAPICWKAEAGPYLDHDGTKGGHKWVRTLERVPLPKLTTAQRVEIAIRVSLWRPQPREYVTWAHKWLSGEGRSAASAREAWAVTKAAAAWAAWAAESAASEAAAEAAWAAESAAAWAADASSISEGRAFAKRLTALIRRVMKEGRK